MHPQVENFVKQRDVSITSGLEVLSEQGDPPINERAARLGPGWDFEPRHIAWATGHRDRDSLLRKLLNSFNKAVTLVKR